MLLAGLAVAVYATSAVLRLRTEETGNLAEPVLATATGRIRWALSHISVAVGGACLLLATAGLSAGLSYGILTGSVSTQVPRLLGAACVRLPATLVLAAVAVLLFGLLPWESIAVTWSAVALAAVIAVFGPPLLVAGLDDGHLAVHPDPQAAGRHGAGGAAAVALRHRAGLVSRPLGLRHRDLGDLGPSRLSCLVRDWIAGDTHQSSELPPSATGGQPPGTTDPDAPSQPPHQARRTG